jgi:hypothetical protein
VVVIGHLLGRAETREAGPGQVPATMIRLTVRPDPCEHATSQGAAQPAQHPRPGARRIADSARAATAPNARRVARRLSCSARSSAGARPWPGWVTGGGRIGVAAAACQRGNGSAGLAQVGEDGEDAPMDRLCGRRAHPASPHPIMVQPASRSGGLGQAHPHRPRQRPHGPPRAHLPAGLGLAAVDLVRGGADRQAPPGRVRPPRLLDSKGPMGADMSSTDGGVTIFPVPHWAAVLAGSAGKSGGGPGTSAHVRTPRPCRQWAGEIPAGRSLVCTRT